jgi:glucokinase
VKGRVVGIDLGGTKVAAALLDGHRLGEEVRHPTELSSSERLIDQLVAIVREVAGEGLPDAVGIGVPSIVEFATGRVISSVNIPLADVPLRRVLSERLGRAPVFVDNDATVAGLAEAHDEELNLRVNNLVMLTIGTGVGGGIVLGGRTFRGYTGGAGELGHTIVAANPDDDTPPGDCFPQPDSLEHHASGRALDRAAEHLGLEDGGAVVEAARRGEPRAVEAVHRWARMVGIGIANVINTFDPEEVVLGGGAAAAGNMLLEPAERVARSYVVPGLGRRTRVRLARFDARAGVLGAALLAVHELEDAAPTRHGFSGLSPAGDPE